MPKLKQTDKFVDINSELSLDNLVGLDGGLDLDLQEEGDGLGLDLEFEFNGDSLNTLGLELNLDSSPVELKKVSDNGIDILKSIQDDNYKYEHTVNKRELDVGKVKRAFISNILNQCKTTENNNLLISKNTKKFKDIIRDYFDLCIELETAGEKVPYTLSALLMSNDIEFDSDRMCNLLDTEVRENVNKLYSQLEEMNRDEIIYSSSNFLGIDIDKLTNYNFCYVTALRFRADVNVMEVQCPCCGEWYQHDLIESTKSIQEVAKGEVYLKHNPLVCDKCNTVSVMDPDSLTLCKSHVIDVIANSDETLHDRQIPAVDLEMLSLIPEAEISSPEIKQDVSVMDVDRYIAQQKTKVAVYNKKFYTKYLSRISNKEIKLGLYNVNAFLQLGIDDLDVMQSYVIGGILKTGYFTIYKELYNDKSRLLNKYLEASKILNFLDTLETKGNLKDSSLSFKKAELELDYGIKILQTSLSNLNIKIKGLEDLNVDNIRQACKQIKSLVGIFIDSCLQELNAISSKVDNLTNYLISNAVDLFRFVDMSEGNSMEYFKVFNSTEQGMSLLKRVYHILVRHVWDRRVLEQKSSLFNRVTTFRNKITDTEKNINNSTNKMLRRFSGINLASDKNSLMIYEIISELPKEFIGLISSVECKDVYKFYYNILMLRELPPLQGIIAGDICRLINETNVPEYVCEVFKTLGDGKDFSDYKTKLKSYTESINLSDPNLELKKDLSLYDNMELVSKLVLCKYVNNFISSKDLVDTSNIFISKCVKYVDYVYAYDTDSTFVEFMTYFGYDTDVIKSCNISKLELDIVKGCDLIHKISECTESFSRRFGEAIDENTGIVELDEYDKHKIIYSELPENFVYLREIAASILYDFGNVTDEYSNLLNILDDDISELMSKYLSCLSHVKVNNDLIKELKIGSNLFEIYRPDFEKLCDSIRDGMSSRVQVEFDLLLNKLYK